MEKMEEHCHCWMQAICKMKTGGRQRDAKVCDKYHDERVKQLDPTSKFTGISGEVTQL